MRCTSCTTRIGDGPPSPGIRPVRERRSEPALLLRAQDRASQQKTPPEGEVFLVPGHMLKHFAVRWNPLTWHKRGNNK